MHKLLGKGSYGKVYKVERKSDKQLYALKEADLGSMSQAERADAVNEVRLLVSISHHNVVRSSNLRTAVSELHKGFCSLSSALRKPDNGVPNTPTPEEPICAFSLLK